MVNPHRTLRILKALRIKVLHESLRILQIRKRDHSRRARFLLETQFSIPGHVLDGEEGAGGDDHEIEVGVGDEDSVRGFDYLGENGLDGVEGAVSAVEHGTGALFPVDVVGCMHGCFHVGAVEVQGDETGVGVGEIGGEAEGI